MKKNCFSKAPVMASVFAAAAIFAAKTKEKSVKRLIQVLVLLSVGAFAFAQGTPPNLGAPGTGPVTVGSKDDVSYDPDAKWTSGITEIDAMSASSAKSVENMYSAGVFGSGIDSYMSVNGYKSLNIENIFVYAGGTRYKETISSNNDMRDKTNINLGFAKNFGKFYAAAFLSGHLPYGGGYSGTDSNDKKFEGSAIYENPSTNKPMYQDNMAFMFAMDSIGAIRLDLIMNPDNIQTFSNKYDGRTNTDGEQNAPFIIALKWGKNIGNLKPNFAVGFKSPLTLKVPNTDPEKTDEYSENARLILAGGLGLGALSAGLKADFGFGSAWTIDGKKYTNKEANALPDSGTTGDVRLELSASYGINIDAGKTQIGISPNLKLKLAFSDNETDSDGTKTEADDVVHTASLELIPALDAGISYAVTPKLKVFTGLSLTIFDWYSTTRSAKNAVVDGNKEKTDWRFTGLGIDTSDPAHTPASQDNFLQFGLTLSPSKNLTIGMGMNTLLDKFFKVDVRNLTVESGEFFDNTNGFDVLKPVSWLDSGTKLFLTVSYQM